MESFETKKALLLYLGKNPDDRKLVDRLMSKGVVWREEGMYYTDLGAATNETKTEEELKFISRAMGEKVLDHGEINRLNEEIEGLKSDLDFQISENGRLEAKVKRYQEAIRNSYYYINNVLKRKIDWPTYKATIKLEGDLPGEDNQ